MKNQTTYTPFQIRELQKHLGIKKTKVKDSNPAFEAFKQRRQHDTDSYKIYSKHLNYVLDI